MDEKEGYLAHHGIQGQKWGTRNGPPYPLDGKNAICKTPNELSEYMKTFRYKEYDHLQTPEQTLKTKSGSCHDQVMFELDQLRKMGYSPDATFIIEYDPKTNQGGTTHSFAYYKDGNKIIWFENAWGGNEGLHAFDSKQEMYNHIKKIWDSSNKTKFTELEFSSFKESSHTFGEDLQTLVDKCLK